MDIHMYTGSKAFVSFVLNLIESLHPSSSVVDITKINGTIISSSCWIFGSLECSHEDASILVQHNAHTIIINVMQNWIGNSKINADCLYVLASMAGCDVDTRKRICKDGVFDKLSKLLKDRFHDQDITVDQDTLEFWEYTAIFLNNMMFNDQEEDYRLNQRIASITVHLLAQTFHKGWNILALINDHQIKIESTEKYEKRQNLVNSLFDNIFAAMTKIFTFHPYLTRQLMNHLDVYNGALLKAMIRCVPFAFLGGKSVRTSSITLFNIIISDAKRFDTEPEYVTKLFDYGLLKAINTHFYIVKTDFDEINLILQLISNILSHDVYAIQIMKDTVFKELICMALALSNDVDICLHAIQCMNNLLQAGKQEPVNLMLAYDNGKFIKSLFIFLDNHPSDMMRKDTILKCFEMLAKACMYKVMDENLLILQLNENKFVNYLPLLTSMKASNNDIYWSKIEYLFNKCKLKSDNC